MAGNTKDHKFLHLNHPENGKMLPANRYTVIRLVDGIGFDLPDLTDPEDFAIDALSWTGPGERLYPAGAGEFSTGHVHLTIVEKTLERQNLARVLK